MEEKAMRRIYRYITAMLLAGSIWAASLAAGEASAAVSGKTAEMQVHYIDVGQGDSTLIISNGHSMLIDAGDDTKGTAIQNYLRKKKVDKLDYLILTHPDADHIGGAPVILTKFKVDKVFVSNYEKDNKTYQKLIQALDNKKLKYTTPTVGSKYSFGRAEITILAPNGEYDNPNDSSIALLIKNGENSFLFTGDAGESAEKDILKNGADISADVYKAGHHGSKYSTSEDFFKAVSPSYAVISCGENNAYGHPHAATLNTFRMNGVAVYRTDEDGTIIAASDGKKITFNVPASETWKAGEPTKTGQEQKTDAAAVKAEAQRNEQTVTAELTYILNTKTKKFHRASCASLPTTNRKDSSESRDSIIAQGYAPCKKCNP